MQHLRDQIVWVKGGIFSPIVLVGNECDLGGERSVATRDGEMLAHEWGWPFHETSAKTGYCIKEAFQELKKISVNVLSICEELFVVMIFLLCSELCKNVYCSV